MDFWPWLLPLVCAALLPLVLIPDALVNRRPLFWARWIQVWSLLGCAFAGLGWLLGHGETWFAKAPWAFGPNPLGLLIDGLTLVMFPLVAYLGAIVSGFSIRYLAGERTQGRFFKWLGFTLGSVLAMVIAGNLALFVGAWIATSLGLHRLLTHYPDRVEGLRAARTKFLISRLGDLLLVGVLVASLSIFGTWDFPEIFTRVANQSTGEGSWAIAAMGFFLVVGAMTKSAQFPFHGWLPDTMETPTPVSAFMHAGIINAGGYLVLRLSPLVIHAPAALDFLTLVGGFTALLGAMVMLTQTAVKRSLAFSTISQMGFMMFQCGMGAFTAALVHIVAHSLYKAHAFLSNGSALDRLAATRTTPQPSAQPTGLLLSLAGGSGLAALTIVLVDGLTGWSAWSKPGAWVLNLILFLALSHLLQRALGQRSIVALIWSLTASVGLVAFFRSVYLAIDLGTRSSLPVESATMSPLDAGILGLVLIGFLGLHLFQTFLGSLGASKTMAWLYCQAVNGFHLDVPMSRISRRLWPVKN